MTPVAEILAGFEALPIAAVTTVLRNRRALIIAPHPDDESLGCGGLIAAACLHDLAPIIVIMTDGAASHPGSAAYPPRRLAALREREARSALKILGLPPLNLHFLRHPDTGLPGSGADFEAAVATVCEIARAHDCGMVVGPWSGDPHCDHAAAAAIAAAVVATAKLPLLSYPVWGWLLPPETLVAEHRRGGWRLDIADQLPVKRAAIMAHETQYGELIQDSPGGFRLPEDLLEIFARPFEVFIA